MHIGMIGGIGPAATELYYRGLIARAKTRGVALELTIVHADIETLVSNMRAGDAGAQVAVYADLARRLQGAGADQLVISSIAGHFCLAEFAPVSPLPIVSMIDAMTARLRAMGVSRVGLLGTEVVMETGFYGGLSGLEVLVPGGAMFRQVDRHYLDMAMAGAADQAESAHDGAVGKAAGGRDDHRCTFR